MEVDWVQLAIEAPLSALFVLFLYKCYRARVRIRYDSECSKCFGACPKLRLRFDYLAPGQDSQIPEQTSETCESPDTHTSSHSGSTRSASVAI